MIKLLIWGVIGYFLYQYFQNKFGLKQGDRQDSIHHHQYHSSNDKKNKPKQDDDGEYIEYEELK